MVVGFRFSGFGVQNIHAYIYIYRYRHNVREGSRADAEVMLAAVKCKQNVDPALADTLAGAVAEMLGCF